jgi:hypothetical protein
MCARWNQKCRKKQVANSNVFGSALFDLIFDFSMQIFRVVDDAVEQGNFSLSRGKLFDLLPSYGEQGEQQNESKDVDDRTMDFLPWGIAGADPS